MRISVRVGRSENTYYYEVNPQEKANIDSSTRNDVRDCGSKWNICHTRQRIQGHVGLTSSPKLISPMGLLANFPQDSVILIPDLRFEMNE